LFNKPASQSSTLPNSNAACAAVNGRKSNLLNAQNCFYTKAVAPWWSVDMLRPYTITQVFFVPVEVAGNKEGSTYVTRDTNYDADIQVGLRDIMGLFGFGASLSAGKAIRVMLVIKVTYSLYS